jgi:hypothetical protein
MPGPAADPIVAPAISCKADEFLFREGERPAALFVVESGQVELLRAVPGGAARVALLGPGDVAGEDSAFGRRASGYSARAVTECRVIRVAAETFLDLLRVRPEVAGHVLAAVGRRLLETRVAPSGGASTAPAAAPSTPPAAPAASPTLPRLVHEANGEVFAIGAETVVVGRSDPRTKFMPDIDLSALDTGRTLSRRHAVVSRRAGRFEIAEEPRVANGTFVNGMRLKPGDGVPLADGDEVCFGLVRTVFRTN